MTRPLRTLVAICATLVAGLFFVASPASADAIDGYLTVDDGNTGQIYTLTQLGTNVTQVTHVRGDRFAIAPRWSPDGHRIAFVIVANGRDRMYTMAADGSDVKKIRGDTPSYNNDAPDYFPDGTRVAFSRCHRNGTGCVIATVGVDGTGLQSLTPERFEVYDFYPAVSPDGTRIAFNRLNADGVHSQVWVMNADGSGALPITDPALEPYSPTWSPDGMRLVFGSNCCRLGGDVYSISAYGGRPTRLTHTSWPNFSGSGVYAPSGREIAFVTDRNYPEKGGGDLYLMRADGAHQIKVSTGLTGIRSVDWGATPTG